jgi:hypothetical protein
MKQLMGYTLSKILLIITLLGCNTQNLLAQETFGIGGVYGLNLENIINQEDDFPAESELTTRAGIQVRYTANQLFHFKSGFEWSSRIIKVDEPSYLDYELEYFHIPLIMEMDLLKSDEENGWFYSVGYGFMFDILRSELADGQAVDTGFKRLNVNFHLEANFGYIFFDRFRASIGPFYNYTINRVVNNDLLGKKRASYFGALGSLSINLGLKKQEEIEEDREKQGKDFSF